MAGISGATKPCRVPWGSNHSSNLTNTAVCCWTSGSRSPQKVARLWALGGGVLKLKKPRPWDKIVSPSPREQTHRGLVDYEMGMEV